MMKLIFHLNYYLLILKFSKILKTFANASSANIKFSKIQLFKMMLSGGILGNALVAIL